MSIKRRIEVLEKNRNDKINEKENSERIKAVAEILRLFFNENKTDDEITDICKEKGPVHIKEWKRLTTPTPVEEMTEIHKKIAFYKKNY